MKKSTPLTGLIFATVVVASMVAGTVLRSRSFHAGFGSDDYTQYAMIKGAYPVDRSPFDLFNFVGGTSEVPALKDYGAVPWWTHPDLRLAMMRPLSSALIVIDHAVFGDNLVGFHVHSMLWWAFLVACVALLLYELLPVQVAAIAVVLFAVEEGHGLPVAWLANRSALVSLSLGLLGLWGHIRWRRGGNRPAAVFSVIMFSLALLAGEWTFPVFAYLFAFELLGVEGPLWRRALCLLPAAILGLAFLVMQSLLDYSALASNVYINPVYEPGVFVINAFQRIPVFFAELVFGINSVWWWVGTPWRTFFLRLDIFSPRVWRLLPDWQFWHFLLGVTAGVLSYYLVRWSLRPRVDRVQRELSWLLLGSLLALVPMVASFPSSRLVVPAFVGVSAAWSAVALHAFRSLYRSFSPTPLRFSYLSALVLAGVFYFQVWQASIHSTHEVGGRAYFHRSVRQWILEADIDDKKVEKQDIFLVNGIEHTEVVFSTFIRFFHGHPLPRSCRILSAAPRAHDITRTATNVLRFAVLGGTMLDSDLEKLYRADRFPLRPKDTVKLDGLQVEILRLLKGKPFMVRFTFDRELEDPGYLFLHNDEKGLRRFKLPRVGERVRLPKAQFPDEGLLKLRKHLMSRGKRYRVLSPRGGRGRSGWK
jgi:hypothetical protein